MKVLFVKMIYNTVFIKFL